MTQHLLQVEVLPMSGSANGARRNAPPCPTWLRRVVYVLATLVGGLLVGQVLCWTSGPAYRESPDEIAVCRDHLAELHHALQAYKSDYGTWPSHMSSLVPTYAMSPEAIHCPIEPQPPYELVSGDSLTVVCRNHEMIIRYCQPIFLRMLDVHVTQLLILDESGDIKVVNGPQRTETVPAWEVGK